MLQIRSGLAAITAAVLLVAGCGGNTPNAKHVGPAARTANSAKAAACPGYVTPYGCQAHSPTFGLPPAGAAPQLSPLTSTVEMFDTVTPSAIPAGVRAVAGYTSGLFVTYPPLVARFPRAVHVSIAVNASHTRDNFGRPIRCLDVEPGDAVPSQAGPWDRQIIREGGRPCDYENRSELPAVQASIRAAGLRPGVNVDEWVADWTFRPHLYPGSACTQWTDHGPHGENYDESTCAQSFFGPVAKSKPPPASQLSVLLNATFPSHLGPLNERLTGAQYLGAIAHPAKYRAYLHGLLAQKLAFLAARIAYVAIDEHQGWAGSQRGSRFQYLSKDARRAATA